MGFLGGLYRKGERIYQYNNSQNLRLLFIENFGFNHWLDGEIFRAIDVFAKNRINAFRCFGFWPYGRGEEHEPYVRTSYKKYDLNRFNESFFEYQAKWVKYALSKGIIVRYEIFDRCGLTTREVVSDHHPYNELVGRDRVKFSDLKNRQLRQIQERYIEKIVSTLAPYPNVIFGIMNEFVSQRDWHYWVSKKVRNLAPDHIIAATEEGNPAVKDANVDMWFVHTGQYNKKTCSGNISDDVERMRRTTGSEKVIGFSTDGFGDSGKQCENPYDMRALAKDAVASGIQMLSFLDQQAYGETMSGALPGKVSRMNIETYQAMVDEFKPTALGTVELPEGMLLASSAYSAPYTHQNAFYDQNGRSVRATTQHGFLFFGNYSRFLSGKYQAVFSLFIDDNTYDDAYIAIIDIVKDRKSVIYNRLLRRKEFAVAGKHGYITLDFEVDDPTVDYELRVFYLGYSYLSVYGVYVINPDVLSAEDIPHDFFEIDTPVPVEKYFSITTFDHKTLSQKNIKNFGGLIIQNRFKPDNKGGLGCSLQLPTEWRLTIKTKGPLPGMEIEDESKGGKVSIFEAENEDGASFGLQRMYNGYRGIGVFRAMFGSKWDSTSIITTANLSGAYSMKDWKDDESHVFQIECRHGEVDLSIDNYKSRKTRFRAGNSPFSFMLGNRMGRLSDQHAQTWFTEWSIEKL